MSDINLGNYGATRISWRGSSARKKVFELIEVHPTFTDRDIAYLVQDLNDEELILSMIEYFIVNTRAATRKPISPEKRAELEAKKNKVIADIQAVIHRAAKIILLDMILPNGKPLRDCTGTECAAFGGWFQVVGERVGKNKVGDVLSEADLVELYEKRE